MSQQDALLCQLIREVLQLEVESQERSRKIEQLLALIPLLPGSTKEDLLSSGFRHCYNAAFNKTSDDVKQNITRFTQKYHLTSDIDCKTKAAIVRQYFVKWVNRILRYDLIDEWRRCKKGRLVISLDASSQERLADKRLSGLDLLISEEQQQENQRTNQDLKHYFEEDLKQTLSCHPDGYPNCTCQELIKRRLLKKPPEKWKNIAKELKIPQGTVTAHWNRKCKPLLAELPKTFRSEQE